MSNKRGKLLAVAVAVSIFVGPSHADIRSALDAMWYTSAGGVVTGSNGMGLYGPSMTIKSPNKTFQVAYFDPPRFSAGCSGIDMTFGSFAMLSIDQFKELVRKIMQAAPGYLMQLAIKAMCEDCASVMQNMQSLANIVNSGQINSCRVSQALFSALDQDMKVKDSGGENIKSTLESYQSGVSNYFNGVWGALNKLFAGGPKAHRGQSENESTEYANTLFNTFYTGKGNEMIDFSIFGSEKEGMQIIQSLIGTRVFATSDQQPAGSNESKEDNPFSSKLTFHDLVNGVNPAKPTQYLTCVDFKAEPTGCQQIQQEDFKYEGVKRYLIKRFAGSDTDTSTAEQPVVTKIAADSIMGKYKNGDTLSTTELGLLRKTPVQLQRLMIMLSKTDQDTAIQMYDQAFQIMADSLAASIALTIASTVDASYTPTTGKTASKRIVPMTDDQKAALKELRLAAERHINSEQRAERIMKLAEAVRQARSLNTEIASN